MGAIGIRTELDDNGTHFYRADFQVHTPRDTNWDGPRPNTDQERKDWAVSFVAASRDKRLNAVAISDHHDFAMYPYVRYAAASEVKSDGSQIPQKEQLVVFPALELTLSVPCQAILILDADFPLDRLDDVLKALHHDPYDVAATTLPSTTVLKNSESISALCAKLDLMDWLKGRYILLPNVTPQGHKSILRQSFQDKYKDAMSVCFAGYLDGSTEAFKKKIGEAKILAGKDKAWGDKHVALFQTSDARRSDFSELGSSSTWVKWSLPTAEALRQASLAHESRISQVDPPIPNVWISRVVVSGSKFMGRVDARLNPQYTALIGGRGTGKSTVLDYIRWALADQPATAGEEDEVADPRVRQRRLIQATLAPLDAHVEVHCIINDIPHVVRRYASSGNLELKVGASDFEPTREAVVQSLLPIQAYSQKQLSSVAIRVDELTRFVTTPILRQLEEISRRQDEARGRLRENYGTLQRYRSLIHEIEQSKVRIRSTSKQAQALRDGLSGLSEEDRAVLNSKADYDSADNSRVAWLREIEIVDAEAVGFEANARAALSRIKPPDNAPAELKESLDSAVEAVREAIGAARKLAADSQAALVTAQMKGGAVDLATSKIEEQLETFGKKYSSVKDRSTAHETKLKELGVLEEQIRTATVLLARQEEDLVGLGEPATLHTALRQELHDLNKERSDALRVQCDILSEASDGLMRAILEVGRNFSEAQTRFRGLVAGSGLRAAKIDALFELLITDTDPIITWEAALTELELVMLLEPDAELRSEMIPTLSRLGMTVQDLKRVQPKLTPDGWLDLSLTALIDQPAFEYQSKPGSYIPFSSASAGQQATALLTTLLSQDGTPLMIDQPEEDLDSETVQQIVAKMWEAKGRRQLILASHNANLVVNGDADLVLVCGYTNQGDQSAGMIRVSGAIDQPAVRDAITKVMEGGELAFKLRKEKYGF